MEDELLDELNRRAAEIFRNIETDGDDHKEVYAHFGLAYYHAEVLHRGLCNLYSLSQVPSIGPVTRPRVEEHLRIAFESTLGQLLDRLGPVLTPALVPRLRDALERRNFLAHHFWFERIHLMSNISGVEAMLNELVSATKLFRELDREIEKIVVPLFSRVGLTAEMFSRALSEVVSGIDCEPLNQQRKPYKQETIIKVFDVPTASGNSALVFQSADGTLWQICDVGLGWTAYDAIDPAWPTAAKFEKLLPATVNPRPTIREPWSFELAFGSQALLSVRLGKRSGEVTYKLTSLLTAKKQR